MTKTQLAERVRHFFAYASGLLGVIGFGTETVSMMKAGLFCAVVWLAMLIGTALIEAGRSVDAAIEEEDER